MNNLHRRIALAIAAAALAGGPAFAGDDPARGGMRPAAEHGERTLTPLDQSNDPRDLELTRKVRQSLVQDDSLSTTAQNVKVVTRGGVVTLLGPVTSEREKAAVEEVARRSAAGNRVDNQLVIVRSEQEEE